MKHLILLFIFSFFFSGQANAQQLGLRKKRKSRASIHVELQDSNILYITMNGMFKSNGDCSSNTPVYIFQRQTDGKWPKEALSFNQMCCGLPYTFASEFEFRIELNKMHISPGVYRVVAASGHDWKTIASNSFEIK